LHRRRIVGVAGIVQLRAIRNQTNQIHLRLHFDISAARTDAVGEGKSTLFCHRYVHKEIDVVAFSGDYRWYIDPLAKKRGVPTAELRGPKRGDATLDDTEGVP
jgi:hypothetical protein